MDTEKFLKKVLDFSGRAGIVVSVMNNHLDRIFSTKHPHLNPPVGTYCYDLPKDDYSGITAYGLGWWMAQAEGKQDEVEALKAEIEALKALVVS